MPFVRSSRPRARVRAAGLLAVALAACSEEPPEAPPRPAPPPRPAASGDPAGQAPLPEPPAAPRGPAEARCEGVSGDPAALARFDDVPSEQLEAAIVELEALIGAHPGSATARARLGELLLRTVPPQPERAATWFERALTLDEAGCALGERDRWAALEGSGISYLMRGDYAGARPFFERSLARWPDVRATRYNLACTQCQTGDLAACAASLGRVFGTASRPDFLRAEARPASHYRELARRDPDLAPLRADPGRFEAIVRGD